MVASVNKKPNLRSACDRCYKLKERCERETTSALCARCKRLGLACATVRPVGPAGRVTRRDHETEDRVSRTVLTRKPRKQQLEEPRDQQLEEEQCTQPGAVDTYLDAIPDVSRYCLGTTDPFAGTAMSDSRGDPWQAFLVLVEIMEYLVYRRKPAARRIQAPASASVAVDRRLGLCLPLLSYYHDLCVISNSLLCATDEAVLARLHWQLDNVNAAVESWQPEHSDQLAEQFGAAELVGLLVQAKAYRLGALLVAHRLRFPFGCGEDTQADIWSKELMAELELARRVAGRPLRFAALPFLVAAVEATGDASRRDVLCRVDCYVDHYAPPLRQVARVFFVKVWRERDLNLNSRWLDSIHKPCPVLAAVDAACF
ncbi:hypothetical protein B0T26DRAFT_633143 [Lasiosphaeria miniovina]|uniref:Zn(2)-C6 fungal-type domain-containing protein n=1 Tax=Lasiosphaeria miniovina TaxID=1954250 RepID=A0AA40BG47_9PEZI|nr:uncharacterized protein B0T26DRAFT_633143 [Lasiosphaeria miniovina]KAK0733620.1 hypothetical protein B0T26DRAFT_633143 [Lasiosphaeria miniovina]